MHEMYCGKDCQACTYREQINCSGCLSQREHCELARCCRSKGHENCETCGFRNSCHILQGKENIPVYRQTQKELLAAREAEIARRAPIMAKWLRRMFWLAIVSSIIGLLGEIPGLALIAEVGSTVCGLGYVWSLLQLKGEDERYGKAAVYMAVSLAASLAITLISGSGPVPDWTLVISLPAAVVAFLAAYNEYCAHSDVVGGVDAELGEKWMKLWKWEIISVGTLIGSILLMLIALGLGALLAFAAAIAALVVSILKLVYLYRSAEVFRMKSS